MTGPLGEAGRCHSLHESFTERLLSAAGATALPGEEFVDEPGASFRLLEHPEVAAARYQFEPRVGDLPSEQVSVLYGDERVRAPSEGSRPPTPGDVEARASLRTRSYCDDDLTTTTALR